MHSMLYIVHGIGNDSVGLVGEITAPVARVGGNIVDMRQDVLHGLFTIYMVVDLKQASVAPEDFGALLEKISQQSGVRLSMEKYQPVARSGERKNLLVTLVGKDSPGIIAAITEKLGKYKINIETSDVVARQGVFLMDLLTDIGQSALPMENLQAVIRESMLAVKINTMFQAEDVFNKRKKVVLFDITGSFIDAATAGEIMRHTGLSPAAVRCGAEGPLDYAHATAGCLEGLPLTVIDAVLAAIEIPQGTRELIQTLKGMGYKIALISNGFSFFTDYIKKRLEIDCAFGYELPADADSQTIVGDLPAGVLQEIDRDRIIAAIKEHEGIAGDDITVISDRDDDYPQTPGIRLDFNMKLLLDFMNQYILSPEALTGLLRSFGLPRL